jgi:hypothetical protein
MMRWLWKRFTAPSALDAKLDEFDTFVAQWERERLTWALERDRMRCKTCSLVEVGCGLSEWYVRSQSER